jgi:hypothetical protein
MFDEPFSLEDELHGVVEEWQSFIGAYREHAPRLLDRGWPFGSDVASADLGALADLIVHAAQLVTLEGCRDRLLGVLEDLDERRVVTYQQHAPSSTGARVAQDVGEPDTSTREPGSEGRARPESGQRKTGELDPDVLP